MSLGADKVGVEPPFLLTVQLPVVIPPQAMTSRPRELLCKICGKPGKLQHDPVPLSCAYCDEHCEIIAGGYDESIDAPYCYFKTPTERLDTCSDATAWYEYHGIWCVRQVEKFDGKTYKSKRDGKWAAVSELALIEIDLNDPDFPSTEISKEEFEAVWAIASPDPGR